MAEGKLSVTESSPPGRASHRYGEEQDPPATAFGDYDRLPITISLFEVVAAGWNICNSWAGLAATLAIGIAQGGTATVVYGILVVFFVMSCTALSLAELAARFPTAGGQYHWTAYIAPERFALKRGLSYACGVINIFGWLTISAGVAIVPPQLFPAVAVYFHPGYVPLQWHIFLEYLVVNFVILSYNLFILRRAEWTHNVGLAVSLIAFIVIVITCLAISSPKQPASYVWGSFYNNSGWASDGVVFLTGLINPNYMYAGIDGAVHLAEDCKNAAVAVPRALMSTILIGFLTTFFFVVAMVYSFNDFESVIASLSPIFEIWRQATDSVAAASTFTIVLAIIGFFALNGCMQTASRLTWSFARDDALVFSTFIGRIDSKFEVPVWALLVNQLVIVIIGCIYLGSTTAFNAIIGTGLILQQLSFAFPVLLVMLRGRPSVYLPKNAKSWNLGVLGWFFNSVTVGWTVLSLVVYNLPFVKPVTSSNMNYTCAVLGAMAIFAIINWFVHANRRYQGPRIDPAGILSRP